MKLGVNIDHIATIRQARHTPYPNIVEAAILAEKGGADYITVHLREDRRHIIDDDLPKLMQALSTPLNLEIAATAEMQQIILQLHPPKICVVPEKRAELTTEGGLDVVKNKETLSAFCAPIMQAGIEISFFIDPYEKQIEAANAVGVPAIELHTGQYAIDGNTTTIENAIKIADKFALKTNAGHGLTLDNVAKIACLPIDELHIGHSIISRALFVGLQQAVVEMRDAIKI